MPIWTLIFCALLGVFARAEIRSTESETQLRANMEWAASADNRNRGLTIIHRWARDFRETPSFIAVGYMEPHEYVSGKRFADFIYARYGLQLILLASYEGFTVPGFDGLVVDKDLNPVANVSLKSLVRPHVNILVSRSERGFHQMEQFSKLERWIYHLVSNRSGRDDRDSALDLVAVLAPDSGRPNWLVVDIGMSDNLTGKDFKEIARLTTEVEHRQAVLMTERNAITIFDGHHEKAPLPKKCQALLRAG